MQTLFTTRNPFKIRELPDIAGLGGAIAGLLAGLVMIIVSPLLSILTGVGIWEPPKLIAATILGPTVLQDAGFVLVPVVIGTVLHVMTATVLGAVFGLVVHRWFHLTTDFGLPIYIGLIYGLLIFLAAYFVILPSINPELRNSDMAPVLVQNMVFGIAVGLFYTFVRPQPYSFLK